MIIKLRNLFDDLVLVFSKEKAKKITNEILSYLSKFYEIKKNKIREIFKIEEQQNLNEAKFEFL